MSLWSGLVGLVLVGLVGPVLVDLVGPALVGPVGSVPVGPVGPVRPVGPQSVQLWSVWSVWFDQPKQLNVGENLKPGKKSTNDENNRFYKIGRTCGPTF